MSQPVKFENVDIFVSLRAILKQNTTFYEDDWNTHKQMILGAVASSDQKDKTLLLLSHSRKSRCFREYDVFLQRTSPYYTWIFYKKQFPYDRVLAYAIELTGRNGKKIIGNLYELDYSQHSQRVEDKACAAHKVKLTYEYGEELDVIIPHFEWEFNPFLGKLKSWEHYPDNPIALSLLLKEEKYNREQLPRGDFSKHITALHLGLVEIEARRTVEELAWYREPNSPDESHYMIAVSSDFKRLSEPGDWDCLCSLLPYRTLVFSRVAEQGNRLYALIDQSEK